jgi:hypothetical protein
MQELEPGDWLFPRGTSPTGHELSETDGMLSLKVETLAGQTFCFEMDGVISYRFTLSEMYSGIIEDSFDKLLILDAPLWQLRLADEDSVRGDFVRKRRFFHVHITDVGVLECYALRVRRR